MTTVTKDWMFDPISGYLLDLDSNNGLATCGVSGYKQGLHGANS